MPAILTRAQIRRQERVKKLSVKQQADSLLWLLSRFPIDQTKDQTKEFSEQALDFASPEIIFAFINTPEIKEMLNATANKETAKRTEQNPDASDKQA